MDHYKARLENGELLMSPYCSCGRILDTSYYCEACDRHCRCYDIICEDEAAFERVRAYIRKSPQFSGYTAHMDSDAGK
ncbi:MAG: hypothetical protein ACOCTS_04190 [Thermodesulfobacteriota bacterium]